jgi:hypothetical protein
MAESSLRDEYRANFLLMFLVLATRTSTYHLLLALYEDNRHTSISIFQLGHCIEIDFSTLETDQHTPRASLNDIVGSFNANRHITRQVERIPPSLTSASQHHGFRTRQYEHVRQAIKEQASKAR